MSSSKSNQLDAPFTPLRRFWRLVAVERKAIVNIYIFAIFAGLISLSLPLGIQAIFNYVSKGQVTTSWVVLIIVVLLGVLLNGAFQVIQMAVAERLQQRIFTHSALEFAFRIPRLKVEALRQQFAPELVNRFFDTLTIQKGFAKILLDLSASSLQIIFGLILLSFYHQFFIIFSIALLVTIIIIIRVTGPTGLKTSLMESKYKYKVVHWLEETARSMESFKLAGNTDITLYKTDEMLESYLDARKSHFRVLLAKYGATLIFRVLILGGMLVIGSMLVYSNDLNIGQFVAMEIVVILLISAVEKLMMSMETIYDILTALEKLGAITDLPLEKPDGEILPQNLQKKGLSISVRDLKLQFPDEITPAIRHVSMNVEAGTRLNIINTDDSFIVHFYRALSGFYEGYSGTISFNNIPLQNVSLADLRIKTGGFTTSSEIFEGSILENITVGNPDVNLARALEIIQAVGLKSVVEELSNGFNSILHTGGEGFSESIRRRIVLARSLAAHPEMLLLKSPFKNFSKTEIERFFAYIDRYMPQTTILLATSNAFESHGFETAIRVENQSIVDASTERK